MPETNYILDILVLLAGAVVAVPLFQRLGLGSVLGYLAAGAAVGPWGLGLIADIEEIRTIAEFGVVFLLFSIGIELKPVRLWAMRRLVFGLGGAQVVVTGLVLFGLVLASGQNPGTALIIGFGLALSSTAFCLQILTERGELGTRHGRTALSVLLFQDLAVAPLLMLVAVIAADTPTGESVSFALLEALLVVLAVILVNRFLLSPVLGLVASSRTAEVFTAAAVLTVIGTAWLMEEVGLSMALGAFLAGLMLADSHYRHQVMADIQPFRGLLLGLFFMGIGMSVDFGLLGHYGLFLAWSVPGLLLVKTAILFALARLAGYSRASASHTSLLLSQGGEFGFVMFGLAAASQVISQDLFSLLTLLVVLTMLTTPLMAKLGNYLGKRAHTAPEQADINGSVIDQNQPRVVIAGFGRVGRRIARILQTANVPYVAIEQNADLVLEARQTGASVFYGNAGNIDVLKAAGAGQAKVLVCTLDHIEAALLLVGTIHQHFPDLPIHVRGHNKKHCDELLAAGATRATSESLEASLQMGEAVLQSAGISQSDAASLVESFRREHYP